MLLWHLVANLSKETLHRVYSINIGAGRTYYQVVGLFTAGKCLLKLVLLKQRGYLLAALNLLSRIDESETWKHPMARKVQVVLEVLFQAALELFLHWRLGRGVRLAFRRGRWGRSFLSTDADCLTPPPYQQATSSFVWFHGDQERGNTTDARSLSQHSWKSLSGVNNWEFCCEIC